ncbi:MAG: methionyl-tRNA formyltransferase [Pyrinomonadaceae bacterium]
MRLVFMGTPEAAVPTLQRCLADGHEVVAVWTQPDKPAGRGNKLKPPPVKEFALAHNLIVHQPSKIKTDEARQLFASYDADAVVVVAYGRILPPAFLSAPRLGCINVHFSLLPKYRGAAPVNWAIVRGEEETGVTTMQMDEGLDTGAILLQRAIDINKRETAPELTARLAQLGAGLLSSTLAELETLKPRPQREDVATFAPILRREEGLIDWTQNAVDIERRVRGLQPWPNAYTIFNSRRLVIWRAETLRRFLLRHAERELNSQDKEECGTVINSDLTQGHLDIACGGRTALRLREIQPEGKRRMRTRDFLNGTRPIVGDKFG